MCEENILCHSTCRRIVFVFVYVCACLIFCECQPRNSTMFTLFVLI